MIRTGLLWFLRLVLEMCDVFLHVLWDLRHDPTLINVGEQAAIENPLTFGGLEISPLAYRSHRRRPDRRLHSGAAEDALSLPW